VAAPISMRRVVKNGFDSLDDTYRAHYACPEVPHDEDTMRRINQYHGHSARHGVPSPAGYWDGSGPGRVAELITRTPGSYPATYVPLLSPLPALPATRAPRGFRLPR